jgi:hypothetical protein
LPAPVDAAGRVNSRLTDAAREQFELSIDTLDLKLRFEGGVELQVLPDSCGYEAWELGHAEERFIACGGGKLNGTEISCKVLSENDIGEKGLACLDGFVNNPSTARRPNDAMF